MSSISENTNGSFSADNDPIVDKVLLDTTVETHRQADGLGGILDPGVNKEHNAEAVNVVDAAGNFNPLDRNVEQALRFLAENKTSFIVNVETVGTVVQNLPLVINPGSNLSGPLSYTAAPFPNPADIVLFKIRVRWNDLPNEVASYQVFVRIDSPLHTLNGEESQTIIPNGGLFITKNDATFYYITTGAFTTGYLRVVRTNGGSNGNITADYQALGFWSV